MVWLLRHQMNHDSKADVGGLCVCQKTKAKSAADRGGTLKKLNSNWLFCIG